MKEPEILEKGDFVDVSLYREVESKKEIQFTIDNDNINDNQVTVLKYLNEYKNKLSTKEAAKILGLSDRATRTVLSSMVEMNLLIRVEKGPQTHYKLNN